MILITSSLRRRFEQNQEDCTFTVLALLPTATDNIMAELETERITFELQQQKAAKLARSGELGSELGMNSTPPSVTDDDGRSMISLQSESGVHASQIGIPSSAAVGEGAQDGGEKIQKARKTKLQLWNDLKISCKSIYLSEYWKKTNESSRHKSIHPSLYSLTSNAPHTNPTQPSWPTLLPLISRLPRPWHLSQHKPRKS